MNNNNNNDNSNKTDPSKQGQANVQPLRDEGKQASAPGKTQGDADTAKRDASGNDSSKNMAGNSAK